MYPGSLFIDGIDFWNFWKTPVDYYYKALSLPTWCSTEATKQACKCDDSPAIEENDDEFTIRFKGMKDSDSGQMSFDGDRTFEVSFERGNGNKTTRMSVKAYIPEKYEIGHEERIEGDDMVFVWPRKKEDKFKDIKCEEHECQHLPKLKDDTESIERTVSWMLEELDEAKEIGNEELAAYLEDTVKGVIRILMDRRKGKCGKDSCRKIIGKDSVWRLDGDKVKKM